MNSNRLSIVHFDFEKNVINQNNEIITNLFR